jgi:hypothetical protein
VATDTLAAHIQGSDPRRLRRVLTTGGALLAAALGVIALVAFGIDGWRDRQAAIDESAATAAAATADVAAARRALESATAQLAATRTTLGVERGTLAAREQDRVAVEEQLRTAEQQLAEQRDSLAAATADLETRRAQLDALDDCVLGVTEALNQVGAHDAAGLARTLRRIEGTCARAGASL